MYPEIDATGEEKKAKTTLTRSAPIATIKGTREAELRKGITASGG
jgi:hypothetical protein